MNSFINIITVVCIVISLQEVTPQFYYVQSHQPGAFEFPTFRSSPQAYTSTFHGNPNFRQQTLQHQPFITSPPITARRNYFTTNQNPEYRQSFFATNQQPQYSNFVHQPAQQFYTTHQEFRDYEPQAPAATRHINYREAAVARQNIFDSQNQIPQAAPSVPRSNIAQRNAEYRGFAYRTQTDTGATSHVLFVSGPQSQQIGSHMFPNPSPIKTEVNQARNIASNMVDSLGSTTEMPLANENVLPKSIQDLYKLPETNNPSDIFQTFFQNPQPRLVNFYSTDSNLFVDPVQNYPASTAPLSPNEPPSNLLNILRFGAKDLEQNQTKTEVTNEDNKDSTSVEAQESIITKTRFRINDIIAEIKKQDHALFGPIITATPDRQSTTKFIKAEEAMPSSAEVQEEAMLQMKLELLKIKDESMVEPVIQLKPEVMPKQKDNAMPEAVVAVPESKGTMLKSEEKSTMDSEVKSMLESQEKSMLVFQGRLSELNLLKLEDEPMVTREEEPLSELKQESIVKNNENDMLNLAVESLSESKEDPIVESQESKQEPGEATLLKYQNKTLDKDETNAEKEETNSEKEETNTEDQEVNAEKEEINSEVNEASVTELIELSLEKEEINSEKEEINSEKEEINAEKEEVNSEVSEVSESKELSSEINSEVAESSESELKEISSGKEETSIEVGESLSEMSKANLEVEKLAESEEKELSSKIKETTPEMTATTETDPLEKKNETNSEVEKSEEAMIALRTSDLKEEQMLEATTSESIIASTDTNISSYQTEMPTSKVDISTTTTENAVTTETMTSTTILPTTTNDKSETTVVQTTQGFLIIVDNTSMALESAEATMAENITTENVLKSNETALDVTHAKTAVAENVTTDVSVSSNETTEDLPVTTDSTAAKQ